MTIFLVYDNDKKAEMPGWVHPVCTDFESAVVYAKKWLGDTYSDYCPDKPDQIIDYSGYGDTIIIYEMGFD